MRPLQKIAGFVADRLLRAEACQAREPRIDVFDQPVAGGDDNAVIGFIGDQGQQVEFGAPSHFLGNVCRELDDLEGPAGQIEDRVVGRLDPYLPPPLPQTHEFRGFELPVSQIVPKGLVFRTGGVTPGDEHRVLFALNFGQAVPHRGQEIRVGGQHFAIQVKLDHGLRTADGGDLAGKVGVPKLLLAPVRGELHDLDRFAIGAKDRVIGCPQPDFMAILGAASVFGGQEPARAQLLPKRLIIGAVPLFREDKQPMVLAANFVQRVAHGRQEIGVGGQHGAVEGELDHRLGSADGDEFSARIKAGLFRRGDVGGKFHHLVGRARDPSDGVIRCLQPDGFAGFVDPGKLGRLGLALPQRLPKRPIGRAFAFGRDDEHTVMATFDLGQRVSHRFEESVIGCPDRAIEREFDDRLGRVDRGKFRSQVTGKQQGHHGVTFLLKRQHRRRRLHGFNGSGRRPLSSSGHTERSPKNRRCPGKFGGSTAIRPRNLDHDVAKNGPQILTESERSAGRQNFQGWPEVNATPHTARIDPITTRQPP